MAQIIPLSSNQNLFKTYSENAINVFKEIQSLLFPGEQKTEKFDPSKEYEAVFGSLDSEAIKKSIEEADKYIQSLKEPEPEPQEIKTEEPPKSGRRLKPIKRSN